MFLTIGNITININHIYAIIWTNEVLNKPFKERTINWSNQGLTNVKKLDHVKIFFNFSITDLVDNRKVPSYMKVFWEDDEEELKALAKAVNFDLTKIGR